jgi:hypothetical protein
VAEASEQVGRHKKEKEFYHSKKRPVGRPPDFDKRIEEAKHKEDEGRKALDTAEKRRVRVKRR